MCRRLVVPFSTALCFRPGQEPLHLGDSPLQLRRLECTELQNSRAAPDRPRPWDEVCPYMCSNQLPRLALVFHDHIGTIGLNAAGSRFYSSSPNSKFLSPVWSRPRPNRQYPRVKLFFHPQKPHHREFALLLPKL